MSYSIMKEVDAKTQSHINCIDVGSDNCPCYLALTGDCLVCSRLQGKDRCECSWTGVCVYNEFIQGNKRVNNPRKDFEAEIIYQKFYKENLVVYGLHVGKGFAMRASRPGSYLFARAGGTDKFYDIPLSVMKTDVEEGNIYLAVKIISAKTKSLIEGKNALILRGPYRSGIHGISSIIGNKAINQKVLIIAKGIGIAPGILVSQVLGNKAKVDIVIDTEKISKEFIKDFIDTRQCADTAEEDRNAYTGIQYISLTDKGADSRLEKLMKKNNYDSVILLVSDYYIENLGKLTRRVLPEANLAVSNNFHICCGEGLCGSCSVNTSDGESIKMCKCRIKGEELLNSFSIQNTDSHVSFPYAGEYAEE